MSNTPGAQFGTSAQAGFLHMRLRQAAPNAACRFIASLYAEGFQTLVVSEGPAKLTIHKNATVSNDHAEQN
jgi:hypothetical protein